MSKSDREVPVLPTLRPSSKLDSATQNISVPETPNIQQEIVVQQDFFTKPRSTPQPDVVVEHDITSEQPHTDNRYKDTERAEDEPVEDNQHRTYSRCRFTGTAGEYFKIWIVNIALMLITLGIYSAWAKVRRNKYIYGNTYFEDSAFAYHADPMSILIGRLIMFVPFVAFIALNYYYPMQSALFGVAIFLIAPYLIVRAIKFRWRITTYRGVSFQFTGTTKESYIVYLFWALVSFLTAGLLYPLAVNKRKTWLVTKSFFGKIPFNFSGKTSTLFWIYAKVVLGTIILIGVVAAIVYSIVLKSNLSDSSGSISTDELLLAPQILFGLAYLAVLVLYGVFWTYIQSRVTNYVWNHTTIKNTSFRGTLAARRLIFLYVTNLLAIVASLGLLTPWAIMRMTKYRVESVHYSLQDSIDDVVGPGAQDKSAIGEEAFGMFDLEIG